MDNKIMIVDEQTGRMDGRRYSDGHKPSKKENVKIEAATQTFATVTLQITLECIINLLVMDTVTEAGELWTIYKLDVVEIPLTDQWQDKTKRILFIKQLVKKFNAVIEDVTQLSKAGRPVLLVPLLLRFLNYYVCLK
jgi:preprotein translocase subunit SecA